MGRQRLENLHKDLLKERKGKREKEQEQSLSYRSLKTDGETKSGEPTQSSLKRERGEERKRETVEI